MTVAAHARRVVESALEEDLGLVGDVTSQAVVPADHRGAGFIVARQPGTIAGLPFALDAFAIAQRWGFAPVQTTALVEDGAAVAAGERLAEIVGPSRTILGVERTALNLLGHLSGVATATAVLVAAVAGTKARIVDTRKTLPGLRALEKYAVRMGGGANHRSGLYDAVLIKDNHIAAVGSVGEAVRRARSAVGHTLVVEVEVDRLDQIDEALEAGADVILLDNMDPETLATAVALIDGRALTEASGGIDETVVRAVAETGVDLISVGRMTHSAPQLDVALDLDVSARR